MAAGAAQGPAGVFPDGHHGDAHAQAFEVECAVHAYALATRGQGASRRVAEQQAAERALIQLKQQRP